MPTAPANTWASAASPCRSCRFGSDSVGRRSYRRVRPPLYGCPVMAAQLWPPCAPTPTGDSAALGLDRRSRFFTVPAVGTAPFTDQWVMDRIRLRGGRPLDGSIARSEEHTSELQSLMPNSYAVFCLKTKTYYSTT